MAVAKKVPEKILRQVPFCPGCGHGIVVRLIMECVEELGYNDNIIFGKPVGCASLLDNSLDVDIFTGAHGRNGASMTAIKRLKPDTLVVSYQGDGDAYNIGFAETMNAAYRNEKFTVVTINNSNFGMTGGQMAWTTMPGQKTSTSVHGRNVELSGLPIKMPEMIATSFDTAYVARGALFSPAEINKTKGYIKKALQAQIDGIGHSMVEVLSPCPTNWHMSPLEAQERIIKELVPYYPLGELKNKGGK